MSGFNRTEHCRRIAAAGGRRTVSRYGTSHMATIGRLGFAKTVELGWGLVLARKLERSYIAKFGKPLTLTSGCAANAKIRAQARRLYTGMACDHCGAPRGQVHHLQLHGDDPNDPGCIRILCSVCHRAEHHSQRMAHLRRPR